MQMVDFDWSPQLQGLLLASFFWGYFLTQLPGGMYVNVFKFGMKFKLLFVIIIQVFQNVVW